MVKLSQLKIKIFLDGIFTLSLTLSVIRESFFSDKIFWPGQPAWCSDQTFETSQSDREIMDNELYTERLFIEQRADGPDSLCVEIQWKGVNKKEF